MAPDDVTMKLVNASNAIVGLEVSGRERYRAKFVNVGQVSLLMSQRDRRECFMFLWMPPFF